jgi:hypothetical protein
MDVLTQHPKGSYDGKWLLRTCSISLRLWVMCYACVDFANINGDRTFLRIDVAGGNSHGAEGVAGERNG